MYTSDDRGVLYSRSLDRHLFGGQRKSDFTNITSLRGVYLTNKLEEGRAHPSTHCSPIHHRPGRQPIRLTPPSDVVPFIHSPAQPSFTHPRHSPLYLSIRPSVTRSSKPSMHSPIHAFTHPCIHPSMYSPIHVFIHPPSIQSTALSPQPLSLSPPPHRRADQNGHLLQPRGPVGAGGEARQRGLWRRPERT